MVMAVFIRSQSPRIKASWSEYTKKSKHPAADALNSGFRQVKMSDDMRQRLQQSNYIFSGIKTFHELNEAFPSLIDGNGNRTLFEQFLNDVQKIDQTYNQHYPRGIQLLPGFG
jgi:hypothetical protein